MQSLGQVGKVMSLQGGYDIIVAVGGRRWALNPKCVVPTAPSELSKEDSEGRHLESEVNIILPCVIAEAQPVVDPDMQLKLLALAHSGAPAVVPGAAIIGDAKILQEYLEKHPQEVMDVQ